jgi:hypothetical protein
MAKESLQYLGFILFSMNHTFTSMIHTFFKYDSYLSMNQNLFGNNNHTLKV